MATTTLKRPPRHQGLLPFIKNRQMVDTMFALGGGLPHASTVANPRPMENISLDDRRAACERSSSGIRRQVPNALWIVFWSNRFKASINQGLVVPPEHLWWVAQETDEVLLSDGIVHHYTSVGHINHSAQTISFIDPWPDEFFLQAGRNVLGIESDGCTVARTDFERVAIGILTWDAIELLDAYFAAFGEKAVSAEQKLRAGHAIMAAGPEYLASRAVKYFFQSARHADAANDDALAINAVAHAWLGAQCALAAATAAGDQLAIGTLKKMAEMAMSHAAIPDLMQQLTPEELCRLAHNSGQIGHSQMVEAATALAIEKDANFEDAYRLRAIAHCRSDPAAASADARLALELNATEIALLQNEMARLRGPKPGGPTEYKLSHARHRRISELGTLAAATSNGGDYAGARQAVIELCTLQPESADAAHKRLAIERVLGDANGIRMAATALLKLDISSALRAEAEAALASIGE